MPQTRISERSHQVVRRIARDTGETSEQILEQTLDLLEKDRLLDAINAGFAALKEDADAWADEQAERGLWDATLADGTSG